MVRALADVLIVLMQLQYLPPRQQFPQHGLGVHVFSGRWPAGLEFQLARSITLQQQKTAGLERGFHALKQYFATGRRGKLDENGDNGIEAGFASLPLQQVGALEIQLDAALLRQFLRFGLGDGGGFDR